MMKLRYPIKVAGTLYYKGDRVRLATLEDVRKIWPAIMPEEDSNQVAVWFSNQTMPTIV